MFAALCVKIHLPITHDHSGVTAHQQTSGDRDWGDGESLRAWEEAHSDHQRSGAPEGREQQVHAYMFFIET